MNSASWYFFVTAGAGIKQYRAADPFGGWEENEVDISGYAGIGMELVVAPSASVRLQFRDYISTFDPDGPDFDQLETQSQHDIVLAMGFVFRVGG